MLCQHLRNTWGHQTQRTEVFWGISSLARKVLKSWYKWEVQGIPTLPEAFQNCKRGMLITSQKNWNLGKGQKLQPQGSQPRSYHFPNKTRLRIMRTSILIPQTLMFLTWRTSKTLHLLQALQKPLRIHCELQHSAHPGLLKITPAFSGEYYKSAHIPTRSQLLVPKSKADNSKLHHAFEKLIILAHREGFKGYHALRHHVLNLS